MSSKYSLPSPPRIFWLAGPGWAYGIGCGVGPFVGMGIAASPPLIFGAGVAAGAFCGIGFGAGFVTALGTGFTLTGSPIPVFFTPRLERAERAATKAFPKFTSFVKRFTTRLFNFGKKGTPQEPQ